MARKKLFLLLMFLFAFSFANLTMALEVPLPFMPANPTLPEYVIYVFRFLVSVAGAISLISFTLGAVALIFSADDPSRVENGKDRIKGAILGLVLTVSSFVILNTINPVLTRPTLTSLPPGAGVFYSDGGNQRWAVASEVSNVKGSAPTGAVNLFYDCDGKGRGKGPNLLVWQFKKPGLEAGNDLTKDVGVIRVPCGTPLSISGTGSFRYDFEKPGVYYFLGKGCSGYASNSIVGSQDKISEPFRGNINSVRIINDPATQTYYGVIFHYEEGLSNGGECDFPIMGDKDCFDEDIFNYKIADMSQSAADIFVINKNGSSGNGVVFYSKPTGWNTNNQGHRQAGFLEISDQNISKGLNNKVFWQDTEKVCFDYTNVDAPDPYKNKCSGSTCKKKTSQNNNIFKLAVAVCQTVNPGAPGYCAGGKQCVNGACVSVGGGCAPGNPCTCPDGSKSTCSGNGQCDNCGSAKKCSDNACESFQDCPGSIEIKGSYLVGVYSEDFVGQSGFGGGVYCLTFTKTVPNLNVQEIIGAGSQTVGSVLIIPIK